MTVEIQAVLLCDDVRQEANGKHILIGVYLGSVGVSRLPYQFNASWWLQLRGETGENSLLFRITDPDGKQVVEGEAKFQVPSTKTGALALPKMPLPLTKVGTIRFEWREKITDAWKIGAEYQIIQGPRPGATKAPAAPAAKPDPNASQQRS